MFKIFKKEDFFWNYCSLLESDNILTVTQNGSIVELSEDEKKWEFKNRNDYVIIPTLSLTKENLVFQIIEPSEYEFIDVYKVNESYVVNGTNIVNEHYVAHQYNTNSDLIGTYYLIKNIKEFKEYVANDYSFVSYNSNYMEEL